MYRNLSCKLDLLMVLCSSDLVTAEPISIIGEGVWSSSSPPAPTTFTLALSPDISDGDPSVGLTVFNITPADSGTTWVITESNANEFALDWIAFEGAMNEPDWEWLFRGTGDLRVPTRLLSTAWNYLTDFTLERIELDLDHYDLPDGTISFTGLRIYGDGGIVPEPTSGSVVAMALLTYLAASPPRRRKRPANTAFARRSEP